MRRLARLSIRIRVTLALAAVVAVVLGATGLFLYVQLGSQLDDTIDQGLRLRAGDIAALVASDDGALTASGRSTLTERGENLAQVLDASGRIVDATPTLRGVRLLDASDLARARAGGTVFSEVRAPGEGDPARLLATRATVGGRPFVVVVGATLEDARDAQRNLGGLLLVGGPITLLLVALAGYGAATGALRPVERMRRQAAAIGVGRPSARLPVPAADDEVARLGATLNGMLERLEESFDRERTFVSDASHELRTPLAILKAELELAATGTQEVVPLRAAIASATEETDRLIQLAEDLLVIARFDQGRLPIRQAPLDARALLEDVRRRFAQRAEEAGASIRVEVAGSIAIRADRLRLEQALGNLVENALRHGGSEVELSAVPAGGGVELHVGDDGAGFTPEFLPRAFERFTRGDGARSRGGSGLGLAIVQVIAEAHGGTVAAHARRGGGAELVMALPAG